MPHFTSIPVSPEAKECGLDIAKQLGQFLGSLDAGLSRGLAGISGSTLVVNIAGSRSAVRDGMATLCPMAAQVIFELSSLEL